MRGGSHPASTAIASRVDAWRSVDGGAPTTRERSPRRASELRPSTGAWSGAGVVPCTAAAVGTMTGGGHTASTATSSRADGRREADGDVLVTWRRLSGASGPRLPGSVPSGVAAVPCATSAVGPMSGRVHTAPTADSSSAVGWREADGRASAAEPRLPGCRGAPRPLAGAWSDAAAAPCTIAAVGPMPDRGHPAPTATSPSAVGWREADDRASAAEPRSPRCRGAPRPLAGAWSDAAAAPCTIAAVGPLSDRGHPAPTATSPSAGGWRDAGDRASAAGLRLPRRTGAPRRRAIAERVEEDKPCTTGAVAGLKKIVSAVSETRIARDDGGSRRFEMPHVAARPRTRALSASSPSTTAAVALSEKGVLPGQQNGARRSPAELVFSAPSAPSTIAPVAARRPSKLIDRPRRDACDVTIDTIKTFFFWVQGGLFPPAPVASSRLFLAPQASLLTVLVPLVGRLHCPGGRRRGVTFVLYERIASGWGMRGLLP